MRTIPIHSIAVAGALCAGTLGAQQSQLDVHGNYSHAVQTGTNSWGAGTGLQLTFGAKHAPVKLSVSPGFDYLRPTSGPSQASVSLDASAQFGSDKVAPYVGGSASSNWSLGDDKEWAGSRLGLETMAGVQLQLIPDKLSAKGEERYGYVKGSDHSWTTRIGVLISI